MRNARDTFTHFLADNLVGPTVRQVRRDPNDPSADLLKVNAVNLSFLDVRYRPFVSLQQCVIDVIADDENTAVDWVNLVIELLNEAYYTPLLDYSNPSSPVSAGSNLMWDWGAVNFIRVQNPNYTHYSCTLPLKFH